MAEPTIEELRDRERIAARLVAYSTALDDKDWPLVEESFAIGGVVAPSVTLGRGAQAV